MKKSFFSNDALGRLFPEHGIHDVSVILSLIDQHRYIPLCQDGHTRQTYKYVFVSEIREHRIFVQDNNGCITNVIKPTGTIRGNDGTVRRLSSAIFHRAQELVGVRNLFDLDQLPDIRRQWPDAELRMVLHSSTLQGYESTANVRNIRLGDIANIDNLGQDKKTRYYVGRVTKGDPTRIVELITVRIGERNKPVPIDWIPTIC